MSIPRRGGCLPGGLSGRGCLLGGLHAGIHPCVNRMTDRCKNITLSISMESNIVFAELKILSMKT